MQDTPSESTRKVKTKLALLLVFFLNKKTVKIKA